jgi:glutamate dehydrogenase
MLTIYENVKRMTDWFIRYDAAGRNVEEIIHFFKPDFVALEDILSSFFSSKQYKDYEEKYEEYKQLGLSESLAERFITLNSLVSVPDIILLSKELQMDVKLVAKVYFALGQQLGFDWLRKTAFSLSGETHWSEDAANTLVEDFYINQRALTKKILTSGRPVDRLFKADGSIIEDGLHSADVESVLIDVMNASIVDFPMMAVINRRLRILAQGS